MIKRFFESGFKDWQSSAYESSGIVNLNRDAITRMFRQAHPDWAIRSVQEYHQSMLSYSGFEYDSDGNWTGKMNILIGTFLNGGDHYWYLTMPTEFGDLWPETKLKAGADSLYSFVAARPDDSATFYPSNFVGYIVSVELPTVDYFALIDSGVTSSGLELTFLESVGASYPVYNLAGLNPSYRAGFLSYNTGTNKGKVMPTIPFYIGWIFDPLAIGGAAQIPSSLTNKDLLQAWKLDGSAAATGWAANLWRGRSDFINKTLYLNYKNIIQPDSSVGFIQIINQLPFGLINDLAGINITVFQLGISATQLLADFNANTIANLDNQFGFSALPLAPLGVTKGGAKISFWGYSYLGKEARVKVKASAVFGVGVNLEVYTMDWALDAGVMKAGVVQNLVRTEPLPAADDTYISEPLEYHKGGYYFRVGAPL